MLIANLMDSQTAPYLFVFKWEFEHNSFRIIITFFVYTCVTLGLLFRFAEGQTAMQIPEMREFTLDNSIWICFITMSTVGYGEISPSSIPGKMVAIICAFMGVIIQAATVIATLKVLTMTKSEEFSYILINIVDIKERVKLKALHVLQTSFRLKKCNEENREKFFQKLLRK